MAHENGPAYSHQPFLTRAANPDTIVSTHVREPQKEVVLAFSMNLR